MPQRCGGKIALVFDTSGSIRENNDIGVISSKNAGLSVINALQGTGSEMAIYNFASKAKSLPRMSTNELLSLDNADDAQKLRSAVEAIDDIKNRMAAMDFPAPIIRTAYVKYLKGCSI